MRILKHFLNEFEHKLSNKIKHLLFLEKLDKVEIVDILSKILLLFFSLYSFIFLFSVFLLLFFNILSY